MLCDINSFSQLTNDMSINYTLQLSNPNELTVHFLAYRIVIVSSKFAIWKLPEEEEQASSFFFFLGYIFIT